MPKLLYMTMEEDYETETPGMSLKSYFSKHPQAKSLITSIFIFKLGSCRYFFQENF